jgi:hypothetical protein
MRQVYGFLLFSIFFSGYADVVFGQNKPKQFIFFSRDREGIHDSAFYTNPGVQGAQITYPWKSLEPEKDNYDFGEIEEDLTFLASKGKKLFIQLQDVTFDSLLYAVPKYIRNDPEYHGGVNSQYDFVNDDETKAVKAGWVSRRWDPAVAARFHKLLQKLADRLDGKIEGINLPESSVEFGTSGNLHPPGFTYQDYSDAIKGNMSQLKKSFIKSIPIQYINFVPGDPDASGKAAYLIALYKYAAQIGVGCGGPDIKVYRKMQMANSYPVIRQYAGIIPTGAAVQEGNYDIINDKTGKKVTVPEILEFAQQYLKLNYIFWCTEEPYYSKEVLPMLRKIKN